MDKFEEKEMKKVRPLKNTWCDCLINYIRKTGGFKDKGISPFKTNTPKQTLHGRGKNLTNQKLKKIKSEENIIENIRNLSKVKTEEKGRIIRDRIIIDIRTLFQKDDDEYFKPIFKINFRNISYIEYESNGDRYKNLSLEEYLNKTKPYLRDIIINLQESDPCKIQLTIVINFISSKDAEKKRVIHSKSNNIKLTSYNDSTGVVNEIFESLCSGYPGNLET